LGKIIQHLIFIKAVFFFFLAGEMYLVENFPNIFKVLWQSEKRKKIASSPILATERQWTLKMDTSCPSEVQDLS
jgi:hypothetical protein